MDQDLSLRSLEGVPAIGRGDAPVADGPGRVRDTGERKILLVIPGRLFRDGVESVLRSPGFACVGGCDTLAEADSLLRACERPDLVLVDPGAPGLSREQLERVRALRARMPATRWVLLSRAPEARLLGEALDAGVDGVLLHDISPEALHHALALVLLGHPFVPAQCARPIAPRPTAADGRAAPGAEPDGAGQPGGAKETARPVPVAGRDAGWTPSLSEREAEILRCLVKGASNKIIARDLKIAEATVKVHIKGLLRKMQVKNRTQAAVWALNNPPPAGGDGGNVVELPTPTGRAGPQAHGHARGGLSAVR